MAYLYYRSSHPFKPEQGCHCPVSDSLLPVRPIRSPVSHPREPRMVMGSLDFGPCYGARTSARHTNAHALSRESERSADSRLSKRVGVG